MNLSHEKPGNYRSLTLIPCPCPVFVAIPPSKDTSATSDPSDNCQQTSDSSHSSHLSLKSHDSAPMILPYPTYAHLNPGHSGSTRPAVRLAHSTPHHA